MEGSEKWKKKKKKKKKILEKNFVSVNSYVKGTEK